jgi:hypothetical protein
MYRIRRQAPLVRRLADGPVARDDCVEYGGQLVWGEYELEVVALVADVTRRGDAE